MPTAPSTTIRHPCPGGVNDPGRPMLSPATARVIAAALGQLGGKPPARPAAHARRQPERYWMDVSPTNIPTPQQIRTREEAMRELAELRRQNKTLKRQKDEVDQRAKALAARVDAIEARMKRI